MDSKAFYATLRQRDFKLFGTSLSQPQVNGLETILTEAEKRKTPLKWLAYMLATDYGKCAHRFLPKIDETKDRETLKSLAIDKCDSPASALRRISKTSDSINFEVETAAPNLWRLRATISRLLSAFVPSNKWAGLTHGGLSHECRTIIPSGTRLPLAISHETTCVYASPFSRGPRPIWPWPNGCRQPCHSQHSASPLIDVFAHSLASSGMIFRGMLKILHVHETLSFNYRCVNV